MEQPTSGYYQYSYEFESHKGSEQLGQFGQCIDQGHIENSVNEHNSRSRIARESSLHHVPTNYFSIDVFH